MKQKVYFIYKNIPKSLIPEFIQSNIDISCCKCKCTVLDFLVIKLAKVNHFAFFLNYYYCTENEMHSI